MDIYQILIISAIILIFILSIFNLIMIEVAKHKFTTYKDLVNLNKGFINFGDLPDKQAIFEKLKTKKEYQKLIIDDYLQKDIEIRINYYDSIVEKNEVAYSKYREYIKAYIKLLPNNIRDEKTFKIKDTFEWLLNIYNRYVYKIYKLKPFRYTRVLVKLSYTSPQGKKSYEKKDTYSYEAVKKHYDHVKKMLETRNTRQNLIRIERAKVTVKLRDEVMKRDNFKCQRCGTTKDDGVLLHVDHIKPISKGGKTELSNLQVLCDRCNLGKSDSE